MRLISSLMASLSLVAYETAEPLVIPETALSEEVSVAEFDPIADFAAPSFEPLPLPEIALQTELPSVQEDELMQVLQEEHDIQEEVSQTPHLIDLREVFAGSPTIYSLLLGLSLVTLGIGAYLLLSLRARDLMPHPVYDQLSQLLSSHDYKAARSLCQQHAAPLCHMVGLALEYRNQGAPHMLSIMQTEGRRATSSYWRKIGLLSEIAIIAPMLGLLGTVVGMFYAFYDLNRSTETVTALFEGLGVSVGTTIGGLIVAILAISLQAIARYRLMKQLSLLEARAHTLVHRMDIVRGTS